MAGGLVSIVILGSGIFKDRSPIGHGLSGKPTTLFCQVNSAIKQLEVTHRSNPWPERLCEADGNSHRGPQLGAAQTARDLDSFSPKRAVSIKPQTTPHKPWQTVLEKEAERL